MLLDLFPSRLLNSGAHVLLQSSILHLCEAEILTACGDGSVELVSKVLVAIVLWKVEFCTISVSICWFVHGR